MILVKLANNKWSRWGLDQFVCHIRKWQTALFFIAHNLMEYARLHVFKILHWIKAGMAEYLKDEKLLFTAPPFVGL